jgi:TolB-like protein/Flp pilus assembly protein TadD
MTPLAVEGRQVFHFGTYEFNAVTGILRKSGIRVRLRPQAAELLGLLVARAGETVTREHIVENLWRGDVNVDFELGINRCIRELRAALSDDAENPRYIRTLARHGYRFIKPVSAGEASAAASSRPSPIKEKADDGLSIVVLPFVNFGEELKDEYFVDGLTEEIINVLAQITHIRVIARTSAFAFKGRNEDVRNIARTLGTNYVVEGSLRRDGATSRVTVQLIRASDGAHIFSKRYDHESANAFHIQDEVARDIVGQLQVHFQLRQSYVPVFAAYEAFLEARHHLLSFSSEGLSLGLQGFERAVQLDPNYSRPLMGLAEYWKTMATEYVGRPIDLLPRALEAAKRAVALDDRDADAQAILGTTLAMLEYRWDMARECLEKACGLSTAPGVRVSYAYWYLLPQGRLEEALMQSEYVLRADPLMLLGRCLKATVLISMRDYAAAARACVRALEINPNFVYALRLLAIATACKGEFDEAMKMAQRVTELRGNDPLGMDATGIVCALRGDKTGARDALERLKSSRTGPNGPSRFAAIHGILGDEEQALVSLEEGVALRDPRLLWLRNLPWFDSVQSNPRYLAILQRMNLV